MLENILSLVECKISRNIEKRTIQRDGQLSKNKLTSSVEGYSLLEKKNSLDRVLSFQIKIFCKSRISIMSIKKNVEIFFPKNEKCLILIFIFLDELIFF